MKKHVYLLKDLDCADCANKIQQELSKNENLKNVTVNFNTLKLIYETDILTKEDVEKIVQSVEPEVTLIENKKSKAMTIDFDSNIVRITASNFSDLKLGYCISIHKAQGSEFDVVIIPILNKYSIMLYKKLIYTATTRAKKKLILIGELSALEKAILNDKENIRKTSLKDFIISCIK